MIRRRLLKRLREARSRSGASAEPAEPDPQRAGDAGRLRLPPQPQPAQRLTPRPRLRVRSGPDAIDVGLRPTRYRSGAAGARSKDVRWLHRPRRGRPCPRRRPRPRRRHACARNAASSASSAIPMPRRSPRSACTPCSIAARRRPASSPSTATRFHSERRLGLVGDSFSDRDDHRAPAGPLGHRPCPLFDDRRDDPAQRPAALRRARRRRLRGRP